MSLAPFWLRYMRYVLHRDPIFRQLQEPLGSFSKDSMLDEANKFFDTDVSHVHPHYGFEGVYSPSEVRADGEKVEVMLDVQNFTPEQIHVKTVGNEVLIQGKKEVKRGDGWTKSHFERRLMLPEGFPPERVECHLDKGLLRLVAFRAKPLPERNVPIQNATPTEIK